MPESPPTSIAAVLKTPETKRPATDLEFFSALSAPARGDALELLSVADERRDYLTYLGTAPAWVFRVLLAADYMLRNGSPDQKIAVILRFLSDYDIDVEGLKEAMENGCVPARPVNYQ